MIYEYLSLSAKQLIIHFHYFHIEVKGRNIINVLHLNNSLCLEICGTKAMAYFTRLAVKDGKTYHNI